MYADCRENPKPRLGALKRRRRTILNDDGVRVKGCGVIYAPKGQAGEYVALAANPYRGCGHKCAYCYVPNVLRMDRAEFDAVAVVRPDYLARLEQDARWVSLEPTIDVEASLAIVDATHDFVDLYKVRRVNYLGITKQPFLPNGYSNPLRVEQHH